MPDIATLIVDLLRKKQEEEALDKGGLVDKTRRPSPEMLGTGGAAKAAEALLRQQSTPMQYVDSLK